MKPYLLHNQNVKMCASSIFWNW